MKSTSSRLTLYQAKNMDSNSTTVERHSGVPKEARHLIWDVFFLSKQRGVALEYHFPWITNERTTTCITINDTSHVGCETVATLVIKEIYIDKVGSIGLIGLVCVHPHYRGRGHSSSLIQHAIDFGLEKSWAALLLWTTKPHIYLKVGFEVDKCDEFGSVARIANSHIATSSTPVVETLNEFGVPAFATEIKKFSNGVDFLIICNTHQEPTLVDWSKNMTQTLELIDRVLLNSWKINAPSGSDLISRLLARGYSVNLAQGSARMVRRLRPSYVHEIPYIGILHRV